MICLLLITTLIFDTENSPVIAQCCLSIPPENIKKYMQATPDYNGLKKKRSEFLHIGNGLHIFTNFNLYLHFRTLRHIFGPGNEKNDLFYIISKKQWNSVAKTSPTTLVLYAPVSCLKTLSAEATTGGVYRNFEKFTGKHLYQSQAESDKVAGFSLQHRRFPVNFAKFLRTPFLQNLFGWLLLYLGSSLTSSYWSCSLKKGTLKIFAKFTEKHLWRCLVLINL